MLAGSTRGDGAANYPEDHRRPGLLGAVSLEPGPHGALTPERRATPTPPAESSPPWPPSFGPPPSWPPPGARVQRRRTVRHRAGGVHVRQLQGGGRLLRQSVG